MPLAIDEIITEVQREAVREHNTDESVSWSWPRFPLSKVVPLCSEIERLRAQVSREQQILAIWNKLQTALDNGDVLCIESYYISRYEVNLYHRTSAGGIHTEARNVSYTSKSTSLLDVLQKALTHIESPLG